MRKITDKFLWGAATSSHQVEGNNYLNDWWRWEQAGKVKEKSGLACDQYNRYKEDFDTIKRLGHNSHRLSLEWSRLQPEENKWNEQEWQHYREVLTYLKSLGIEPLVTLNHFTLPAWLADKGGWTLMQSRDYLAAFGKKAVEELGDLATYWITINEPMILSLLSYYMNTWPPGGNDLTRAFKAIEVLMHAHVRSYRLMHEAARDKHHRRIYVGIAKEAARMSPCDKKYIWDFFPVFYRHHFYNHMFIWAVMHGWIMFPGYFMKILPYFGDALDFIGINYYRRYHIKYCGVNPVQLFGAECKCPVHIPQAKYNNLGWEVYPQGLYDLIRDFSKYRLPIIITENGITTNDDDQRIEFIMEHLDVVKKARDKGYPVVGYFYWSLIDNFEWADGYAPHFGLIEVDYASQKRTIRKSGYFYSEYIKKIGLA